MSNTFKGALVALAAVVILVTLGMAFINPFSGKGSANAADMRPPVHYVPVQVEKDSEGFGASAATFYQYRWADGHYLRGLSNGTVWISAQYIDGGKDTRTWQAYGWTWTHKSGNWYRDASGRVVDRNPGFVPNSYSVVSSPFVPYSIWHNAQVSWGGGSTPAPAPAPSRSEPHGALRYGTQYAYGNCTRWAWQTAHNDMRGLGNAKDWNDNAARQGYRVVSYPVVGSTIVFEGGVQGASGAYGHVGHVVSVSGNRVLISEMNVSGVPGGGFNKVDQRWVSSGYGVSFILPK